MYHYKECGLPYVYLTNGFTIDKVEDEEFVSIDNLYELHALIGRRIVSQVRPISHQEFKFIRIELNMSQKALGSLLGVDTQTVARWERDNQSSQEQLMLHFERCTLSLMMKTAK